MSLPSWWLSVGAGKPVSQLRGYFYELMATKLFAIREILELRSLENNTIH